MARVPGISNAELTPRYARVLAPLIRPFPNFDVIFVRALRRRAVQLLQLRPGDRVIDAGCGPGGSFAYLVEALGASGEVVGVEISPEMAQHARRRIEKNRWNNVHVAQSAAETVRLEGMFDALLMLGAPDVYGSSDSLDNLLLYLKDGARVVAFGAKLKRTASGKVFNSVMRGAFSKLTFASTPKPEYEPCALLQEKVNGLQVQEQFFGWMFLASGTVNKNPKR